jgi:hypothetical protein
MVSGVRKDNGFHVAAMGLTLLLLIPIWGNRFVPLQDYPQHLFNAYVGSTYDDPSLNWSEHLRLENPIAPYRLSSYTLRLIAAVTGPETAGKLVLSLYVLLVLLLVYRVRARVGSRRDPWSALLFFPLAFHQMYFFGFLNFILSIPLLLLALLDLEAFVARPLTGKSVLRQGLWSLGLFIVHPFTVSIYIVLAFARLGLLLRDRDAVLRGLLPPLSLSVLYVVWVLESGASGEGGLPQALSMPQMRWWPFRWRWDFILLPFAGMRITRDPALLPVAAWTGIGVLVALSATLHRREWRPPWPFVLAFSLVAVGYVFLPFSVRVDRRYTFFGTRLAPISYFLFVLVLAAIPMRRYEGQALAGLCGVLLLFSADLQKRVSSEVETIVPITARMRKNAAVLPLIPRSASAHLDPFFYAQFHHHEIFYYHILVGGGINPWLFGNRLMLVRYNEKRPPRLRGQGNWPEVLAYYDYIIARGPDARTKRQLRATCSLLVASGEWQLYEVPRQAGRPTADRLGVAMPSDEKVE